MTKRHLDRQRRPARTAGATAAPQCQVFRDGAAHRRPTRACAREMEVALPCEPHEVRGAW